MFSSKIRRVATLAVVPAAAFAALSLGTAVAQAAPVGQYQDSSVQIFDNPIPLQHIDAITGVPTTAVYAPCTTSLCAPAPITPVTVALNSAPTVVPSFSSATVKFSAVDALGPFTPLTYSIVNTVNLPSTVGLTISNAGNTGEMKVTPIPAVNTTCPYVAVTNANNISVTVKVTDGTAVGFETLTAVPQVIETGLPTGCIIPPGALGFITQITVTAATDTVTLAGTNDNANGTVVFNSTSNPAVDPVTWAASNLPGGTNGAPGVTLTGNVLSATSTVPGAYNDMHVTATDAMGATADDRFDILVKGGIIGPSTPVLSGGHAACGVNHSRMNVFYVQSGQASWDHFTIVGPGAINGHQGWVFGNLGLNEAVYGGLLAGHGYTVYYQPVTGSGSTTPILGSHWGYVYFKAGQGC